MNFSVSAEVVTCLFPLICRLVFNGPCGKLQEYTVQLFGNFYFSNAKDTFPSPKRYMKLKTGKDN